MHMQSQAPTALAWIYSETVVQFDSLPVPVETPKRSRSKTTLPLLVLAKLHPGSSCDGSPSETIFW